MQETIKIEGSKKRELLFYIYSTIIGYAICFALFLVLNANLLDMIIMYGILSVGSIVSLFGGRSRKERYVIEISDEYIIGPRTGYDTVSIPIEAIHQEKTFKHSIWKKFMGYYRICAKNGVSIIIDRTIFTKVQIEQIYNTLALKLNS